MRTAYKCRAYPTQEQAQLLYRTFGCIRVVWNQSLANRHQRWHQEGKSISYREADANLTVLKQDPEFEWLNEVSSVALQQAIRHQHSAFQAFFAKRARYPRFKTRNSRQSATFTKAGMRIDAAGLRLAKFTQPLKIVWSWPDVSLTDLNVTSLTVSRDSSGRWFVSFSVESEDPKPLPLTRQSVGIDLGLTDIAVLSTGEKIAHPRHMDKHERKLKRYQRMIARRQKGSARREKARKHVARQHAKVADARRDHMHKLTTKIVRENDVIAIEDLVPKNMVRNRRLSKSISRTGWGEFRRQLEYKSERAGRELRVCNRWFPSSKTCSNCGHLLDKLNLGTRHWTCPTCGTRHDRDVNAAKNILVAAGQADTQNARGADLRPVQATARRSAVKRESSSFTEK